MYDYRIRVRRGRGRMNRSSARKQGGEVRRGRDFLLWWWMINPEVCPVPVPTNHCHHHSPLALYNLLLFVTGNECRRGAMTRPAAYCGTRQKQTWTDGQRIISADYKGIWLNPSTVVVHNYIYEKYMKLG